MRYIEIKIMNKYGVREYIINELQFYGNSGALFARFEKDKNIRKTFAYAIFLDSTILRNLGKQSLARNVLAHTKSAEFLKDIAVEEFWAYCKDYFSDAPISCDGANNAKLIKKLESLSECERIQQFLSIISDLIELLNIDNPSIFQRTAILVDSMRLGEIQFHSPLIGTRQHKLDDLKKYNKNINHILGKFQNIRDAIAHPNVQEDLTYKAFIQQQFLSYKEDLNASLDCMNAAKEAAICYYEVLTEASLKKASQVLTTKAKFSAIKQKFQLLTKQYDNCCEMFSWAEVELSPHVANVSDKDFSKDWGELYRVIPSLDSQLKELKNEKMIKKIQAFESMLEEAMLSTFVFICKGYIIGIISDLSTFQRILDKNNFFLQKSWNSYTKNKRKFLPNDRALGYSICPLMWLSLESFSSNPELTRYIFTLQKKCYRKVDSTRNNIGDIYLFGLLFNIKESFIEKENIEIKEKSLRYFFDIFYTDLNRLPIIQTLSYPSIFIDDKSSIMLKVFFEKYPSDINKKFKLTHTESGNDLLCLTRIKEDIKFNFFTEMMEFCKDKQNKQHVRNKLNLLLSYPDFWPLVSTYYYSGGYLKKTEIFATALIREPELFDDSLYVLKRLLNNEKLKDQCQEMLHVYLDYLSSEYHESSSPNLVAIQDLNYIGESFHIILTHDNFDPTYIKDGGDHILKNFWNTKGPFFEWILLSFLKKDPSGELLKNQLEFEVPIITPSDIMNEKKVNHKLSYNASENRIKIKAQKIIDNFSSPPNYQLKGFSPCKKDYARSQALNSMTSAAKRYANTDDGKIIIEGVTIWKIEESLVPFFKNRSELTDKVYAKICDLVKIPKDIEKLKNLMGKLIESDVSYLKLSKLYSKKIETLEKKRGVLTEELDSILAMFAPDTKRQHEFPASYKLS